MHRCDQCHRRVGAGGCREHAHLVAQAAVSATTIEARVPGFELERVLGVGGDARVFRARRLTDGAVVALKLAHTREASERLAREAAAMQLLPGLAPRVEGLGATDDGLPWLAMELLEGETLADWLVRVEKPFTPAELVAVLEPLCNALSQLEARSLVHRDLKPENIFFAGAARALRLLDFGLACAPQTVGSGVEGSLEYLSPEQVNNEPVSAVTDLYSVGVIAYELLTLRVPFLGTEHELAYGHLALRPPGLGRVLGEAHPLEAIVLSALAKSPRRRPASATAWLASLGTAAGVTRREEAAPAPAQPTEARAVDVTGALVFVEFEGAAPPLEPLAAQHKLVLAHSQGQRHVFVALPGSGQLPLMQALALARQLARTPGAHTALDIGLVKARTRRGGRVAMSSPLFQDSTRFPGGRAGAVLVSRRVVDAAPALQVEVAEAPGWLKLIAGETTRVVEAAATAESRVFGRETLLRTISTEARAAVAAGASYLGTLVGEAGVGRSMALRSVAREVHGTGRVMLTRFVEEWGAGEDTLTELLRYWLGLGSALEGVPRALNETLGHANQLEVAALGAVMGWLAAEDPRLEPFRVAPGVLRQTVSRLLGEAFVRAARLAPLVLLLDDVHAADEVVLEALEQAVSAKVPLAVIATAQPGLYALRPEWGRRAASQARHQVEPLAAPAAHAFFRQLLEPVESVPTSILDRLHGRCEGYPRRMSELVRGLRAQGFVRPLDADAVLGAGAVLNVEVLDQLPDSPVMEWWANQELARLAPGLRQHARIAAVLGREVDPTELEDVISALPEREREALSLDTDAAVGRLLSQGVFARSDRGHIYFALEAVQAALKAELGADARAVHRLALERLSAQVSPPLARLAGHAEQVGERQLATRTWLELGALEQARHRYLDAERAYSRAIALVDDGLSGLVALQNRGIMRYRLGRFDIAMQDFERSKALARQRGDAAALTGILLDEAMAADWNFEFGLSAELAREASTLGSAEHPLMKLRLVDAQGRAAMRASDVDGAVPLLREAADQARAMGDTAYEVEVTANLMLGFLLPMADKTAEAEARLNRVDELTRAKSDELHRVAMLSNRACLWIALNDVDRFNSDTAASIEIARRLGNFSLERNAELNAAYFHHWRDEGEAALPAARAAVRLDDRWYRGGHGDAHLLLARILYWRGELDEARSITDAIAARQAEAMAANDTNRLLAPNDVLLLRLVRALLTTGTLPAWDELRRDAHQHAAGQELIEVLEAMGLDAQRHGETSRAHAAWTEALSVCQRIPNVMEARLRERVRAGA